MQVTLQLEAVTFRHLVADRERRFRRKPGPGIHDLDLSLGEGEIVGLVGRNGAGKSTLLKVMAGILPVQRGVVLDRKGTAQPPEALRRMVGHMPEQVRWQGKRTLLAMLQELAVMDGGRLDLVEGAIRLVGLQEQMDLPMDSLSQGMRQRLTLASAMLGSPEVLLLDEPYNGLDPAAARSLTRVLTRLAQRGVSVVISSHHLDQLEGVVNRLLLLDRGRLIAQGPADRLSDDLGLDRPWETVVEGERPEVDAKVEDLGQMQWCIQGPRMSADLLTALEGREIIQHGRRKVDLADLLDRATWGEEE
jgi:ABC-2 type transport system ATP-binding protein